MYTAHKFGSKCQKCHHEHEIVAVYFTADGMFTMDVICPRCGDIGQVANDVVQIMQQCYEADREAGTLPTSHKSNGKGGVA